MMELSRYYIATMLWIFVNLGCSTESHRSVERPIAGPVDDLMIVLIPQDANKSSVRQRMALVESEWFTLSLESTALGFEQDDLHIISQVVVRGRFHALVSNVDVFANQLSMYVHGNTWYLPDAVNIEQYSLPADTISRFEMGIPYTFTLVYASIEYSLLEDTLRVDLQIPNIVDEDGRTLMTSHPITFVGQRNSD